MLGIVALVFGASLLTFNLTNEYLALNRETPLTELPSFRSALERTGIRTFDGTHRGLHGFDLKNHSKTQFFRIGGMSIPYYLPGYENKIYTRPQTGYVSHMIILGIIVFVASLAGLLFTRYKLLMATLILFGVVWGVIMVNNIHPHEFEALFLIGVPLALFSVCIDKLFSRQVILGIAVLALLIFVLSVQQISHIERDKDQIRYEGEMFEDFEAIRQVAKDKIIYIHAQDERWNAWEFTGSARYALHIFLAGNSILFSHQQHLRHLADFVIKPRVKSMNGILTPQNRHVFLYDREIYDKHYQKIYRSVLSGEPVIQSKFDVYLYQNTLFYIKEQCKPEDTQERFLVHVYPVDVDDLPEYRRQLRFDNLDFRFDHQSDIFGGMCATQIPLPEYDIASIRTGQYIPDGALWSEWYEFSQVQDMQLHVQQYQVIYGTARSSEPVIRSKFDVHLDQNTLFYIKEQCSFEDIQAKFLLHVTPVDASDLPEGREQYGFDNLDFNFNQRGGRFDQKCAAQVQLPEYDIASIRTGQYISEEGELWSEWHEVRQAR